MPETLVSMELPKAPEVGLKEQNPVAMDSVHEKYPWGLRITLNKEEIAKLKLPVESYSVDDEILIKAKGLITSIEQRLAEFTGQGKEKTERVEIQLTELLIVPTGNFEESFKEALDGE